jgi:formylglycine-generating enzyme required for sulfatase activity
VVFKRRIAVIVGVSEYGSAAWPPLPYVKGDIEGEKGLAATLERDLGPCSFARENIHVRLNKFTHRDNITFILKIARDPTLDRDDLLFLYFSGHGVIDEEMGSVPCLIMPNSDPADPSSKAIPFKWIRDEIIQKTKASVLVVIDCCFSGQIISQFNWSKEVVGDHFGIFTSSAKDQESFADQRGDQSYFTRAFIEALRGEGAALCDGKVDTDSVIAYILQHEMSSRQDPQFLAPKPPFQLSVPRRPIAASARSLDPGAALAAYARRFRTIGEADTLLTSDTEFVRSRADVKEAAELIKESTSAQEPAVLHSRAPALETLKSWAEKEDEPFSLVLGETGLGKTTLLRRLCFELSEEFLAGSARRCPIFLDLRIYLDTRLYIPATLQHRSPEEESLRRFRSVLIDWLQNEEGLPLLWTELLPLVGSGQVLLVLDGLDEMCLDSRTGAISACLKLLSTLQVGKAKMLLSCRTNYFRSDSEMVALFCNAAPMWKSFPVMSLRQFGEAEIVQYLDWHLRPDVRQRWSQLRNSTVLGLDELSRRPFLLTLLVKHLHERSETSPTKIFEDLLHGWLERDRWRFAQFLEDFREAIKRDLQGLSAVVPVSPRDQQLAAEEDSGGQDQPADKKMTWPEKVISQFLELLALDLRFGDTHGVSAIPVAKLPDRIKHYFPSLPEIFIDFFEYCIRTCTFLSRDSTGNYSFVHDSVQAFFAARQIYSELREKRYGWDGAPDRGQPGIEPLPHSLGKAIVDEFLMEFLSDMVHASDVDRLRQLFEQPYALSRVRMNPHTLFYLSGNALSLLVQFYRRTKSDRSLPRNLQDRNISGADLSACDLRGVNFTRCIMEEVNLRNADLRNATLNGVQLIDADLHGTRLAGVKINGGAVVKLRRDSISEAPPEFLDVIEKSRKGHADRVYNRPAIDGLTEMVKIPGGRFMMGTSAPFADKRERPQHEVVIDPFYLDIYPVTNGQFAEFINANPEWGKDATVDRLKNIYYLKLWDGDHCPDRQENFPVVYVSWYAAEAYAKWAGLRLPTEAEWEFALRDGNHEKAWDYPWGPNHDSIPPDYENAIVGRRITAIGAIRQPNYGLYDMTGNVNEWVSDWFGDAYFGECMRATLQGRTVNEPKGPPFGHEKVLRGGSFLDGPKENYRSFTCFHRAFLFPQNTNQDGGFRCAKDVNEK